MRIGIFGGSFNPPHKKHIKIANELIDKNYVDKVIFVPTGNSYSKRDLIDFEDRYNMLKLLETNNILVSDISREDKYTYEVLDYFNNGTDELFFICGIDNLDNFDKWKRYEYVLEKYKLLVINRSGYSFDIIKDKYNSDNIILANIETENISSSMIREKLNNNEDVSEYVDGKVLKYIKDKKLYEL